MGNIEPLAGWTQGDLNFPTAAHQLVWTKVATQTSDRPPYPPLLRVQWELLTGKYRVGRVVDRWGMRMNPKHSRLAPDRYVLEALTDLLFDTPESAMVWLELEGIST